MEYFNESQIIEAKTSDLVAFWNEHHADKPIVKFTNRTTAEKRCVALMDALNSANGFDEETGSITAEAAEALGGASEESTFQTKEVHSHQTVIARATPGTKTAFEVAATFSLQPSESSPAAKEKKEHVKSTERSSNSAGVSASWADPAVAQARLTRNSVEVEHDGVKTSFKSVREAFRHYRLLDSKHIRFRGMLKAEKKRAYEEGGKSYLFTILD